MRCTEQTKFFSLCIFPKICRVYFEFRFCPMSFIFKKFIYKFDLSLYDGKSYTNLMIRVIGMEIIRAVCDTDVERHKWRTIFFLMQPTSNNTMPYAKTLHLNTKIGNYSEGMMKSFLLIFNIFSRFMLFMNVYFLPFLSRSLSRSPFSAKFPIYFGLSIPLRFLFSEQHFGLPFVPMRSLLIALQWSVVYTCKQC